MNGAIAEPLVKTISTPNNNKTTIIGNNQNFLRSFKNKKRSFKNSIKYSFFSVNKVFLYHPK